MRRNIAMHSIIHNCHAEVSVEFRETMQVNANDTYASSWVREDWRKCQNLTLKWDDAKFLSWFIAASPHTGKSSDPAMWLLNALLFWYKACCELNAILNAVEWTTIMDGTEDIL